jgi:hypothetical protein
MASCIEILAVGRGCRLSIWAEEMNLCVNIFNYARRTGFSILKIALTLALRQDSNKEITIEAE